MKLKKENEKRIIWYLWTVTLIIQHRNIEQSSKLFDIPGQEFKNLRLMFKDDKSRLT